MSRVAAIDIGTFTMRLAIADVADGRVQSMRKQSTIVNLGQDVDATGMLALDAMKRAFLCARAYAQMAKEADCDALCCTLTSAARDAGNSDELMAALSSLGITPEVIPGEIEGALTFLGVAQDFRHGRMREHRLREVGGGEVFLRSEGIVIAHEGDPSARAREVDRLEPIDPHGLGDDRKVDEPSVEQGDGVGGAARGVVRDGVDAPLAGDVRESGAFFEVSVDAPDVDVANRAGGHDGKVPLDLVGEGNHLLGRMAQLLARLGEPDAVRLTHEELLPELLLEVLELS